MRYSEYRRELNRRKKELVAIKREVMLGLTPSITYDLFASALAVFKGRSKYNLWRRYGLPEPR